jgi:hypothetical protein
MAEPYLSSVSALRQAMARKPPWEFAAFVTSAWIRHESLLDFWAMNSEHIERLSDAHGAAASCCRMCAC